jgi:hypothetical protein
MIKFILLLFLSWFVRSSNALAQTKYAVEVALRNTAVACGVAFAACLGGPISSLAVDYPCPNSFASQPLGIQNVIRSSPSLPPPPHTKTSLPTARSCAELISSDATTTKMPLEYSVQGIVYMPPSTQQQLQQHPLNDNASLVITIASVNKPSVVLAGAQIPMQEIPSFPISVSLSKSNLLLAAPQNNDDLELQWDKRVLYAPHVLIVAAQIKNSDSAHPSSGSSAFQGQGYSKLLNLPDGDEDFRVVRAAASIRLTQ